MGRFSAWADTKAAELQEERSAAAAPGPQGSQSAAGVTSEETPQESSFLVDNVELQSPSKGLRFRRSPDIEDKDSKRRPAPFGAIVRGCLSDDGQWLRVRRRYLPVFIQGKRVLVRWHDDAACDEFSEDEPGGEQELRRWRSVRSPAPTRLIEVGCGALWEVVAERVFLRAAPAVHAHATGTRTRGQVVELFDWDSTMAWRRTICPRTQVQSWMLLDHPELGALLRPQGRPLSVRPVQPWCEAVREGAVSDVARFLRDASDEERAHWRDTRDVDGKTPLLVAAETCHLELCALLLGAGARLSRADAARVPAASPAWALLDAAAGAAVDADALEFALEGLSEEAEFAARQVIAQHEEPAAAPAPPERPADLVPPVDPGDPMPDIAVAASTLPPELEGIVYEVVHKAIFVRSAPSASASAVSSLKRGDLVDVVGFDPSRCWGRAAVQKPQLGTVHGWVLLEHDELGTLLRRCSPR